MANSNVHKLRATLADGGADVRVLIQHPMENGNRTDPATGAKIPAHYIQEIHCEHNQVEVLRADWGRGVAMNPFLAFRIQSARPGDIVRVRWVDNRGGIGAVEGVVG